MHRTTIFAFVAMYCRKKKNWIVLRAKHQRDGFYYYLYGLTFYLQLACGPQRLCKAEYPAAHEELLKGPQVVDHCRRRLTECSSSVFSRYEKRKEATKRLTLWHAGRKRGVSGVASPKFRGRGQSYYRLVQWRTQDSTKKGGPARGLKAKPPAATNF